VIDSKWNGGWIEFQTPDGSLISREPIHAGIISASVPANSRIVLSKEGLQSRMFYIAMENAGVEKDISYLVYEEFRRDYPNLLQNVVPPQVFHLQSLRQAVPQIRIRDQVAVAKPINAETSVCVPQTGSMCSHSYGSRPVCRFGP
jgi:hypothetical protein